MSATEPPDRVALILTLAFAGLWTLNYGRSTLATAGFLVVSPMKIVFLSDSWAFCYLV